MQPPQGPYQPTEYQNYPPQAQPAAPQWTQMPVPGQGAQGQGNYAPQQPMLGQVPPPAQLDPSLMPGYAPQQPVSQPMQQGQAPQQHFQQPNPPQAQYQAPKTGIPKARKKAGKGAYIALAVVAIGFALFAVLRMISPGQVAYGYVQSGSLSGRYTGDAVIVRNETVYAQQGVSQIDYVAEEGAQVVRGNTVATIYASGFSSKEWTTLNNYRSQIREHHKILIDEATTDTKLLSLMTKVKERILETQQLVQGAQGSLSNQEELLSTVMQDRQIYMKQKYPDDQKLTRLYGDENTQLNRISNWIKQYAATADGLVSFYTDGYETALNMSNYGDYTPVQVRAMYKGEASETETTTQRNMVPIYRLVRQEPWAVLMLCNEMEWTPVTGRSYKLLIESFDNTIVDAAVESFTRSGGELLVRLRVENTAALSDVLYIRNCRVQLGESVNTLVVPSRAIHIQNGRKGVVTSTEGGEYWTGVEVISDDGAEACIIPENPGVLYEGLRVRLF